jgi:protein-disulfide isomerase
VAANSREFVLITTRRDFTRGVVSLALAVAAFPLVSGRFGFDAAYSQSVSTADLYAPGVLDDMVLGNPNASVTMVEYASTTCPHCAHFAKTTYPELKKRYIDTNKIRYIYREFVLNQLDAAAVMLLRCVDKEKYFPLLETLFQKQGDWVVQKPLPPLLAIAKQAGFTEERFNQCLSDQSLLDKIEAERKRAAEKFGVNSTPTFFINGKVFRGDMSLEQIEKEITPLLKGS